MNNAAWRKVTEKDLFGITTSVKNVNSTKKIEKVLGFRRQVEYGAKKFIKP
jgi:hypothetical protein